MSECDNCGKLQAKLDSALEELELRNKVIMNIQRENYLLGKIIASDSLIQRIKRWFKHD